MAHRVIWSPAALEDVEAIAAFIARDSPRYAAAVVGRIVGAARQLSEFPNSGPAAPGFHDPKIRHLVLPPYRVLYRLGEEMVTVAAVVHISRSFEAGAARVSGGNRV